ncbi:hypothetical protein LEN26_002897 [Aphanomyces euteiches]|nr:hypothetical protein AeMF1_008569 [Aphanomyces euteiches]KAH9158524.1 hypothetical protein LEN26_002897 [Aphanomyces euteiches]KAH9196681.1 hypothetical protein AeNC1_001362 [Aphanomyces euteiches]
MASGANFFRGTTLDQDSRFFNKHKKLMEKMDFPKCFKHKVDISKVNKEVMNQWITEKITELLGFEDDIVVSTAINLLEPPHHLEALNPKEMQVALTGFLEGDAYAFMDELWTLLLSAQENPTGIPQVFLDKKKKEMEAKREKEKKQQERLAKRVESFQQSKPTIEASQPRAPQNDENSLHLLSLVGETVHLLVAVRPTDAADILLRVNVKIIGARDRVLQVNVTVDGTVHRAPLNVASLLKIVVLRARHLRSRRPSLHRHVKAATDLPVRRKSRLTKQDRQLILQLDEIRLRLLCLLPRAKLHLARVGINRLVLRVDELILRLVAVIVPPAPLVERRRRRRHLLALESDPRGLLNEETIRVVVDPTLEIADVDLLLENVVDPARMNDVATSAPSQDRLRKMNSSVKNDAVVVIPPPTERIRNSMRLKLINQALHLCPSNLVWNANWLSCRVPVEDGRLAAHPLLR